MQSSMEPDLFPSFSDKHTVALWLFDEPQYFNITLTDASENMYDLRLLAGGQLMPGKFGNALRFSSQSGPAVGFSYESYRKGTLPDLRFIQPPGKLLETLAEKDWTLEFWLKVDALPQVGATIVEMGTGNDMVFSCGVAGRALILRGSSLGEDIACPTDAKKLADGQWHHVAFTRTEADGKVRHFLDGQLQPGAGTGPEASAIARSEHRPGLIGTIFREKDRNFGEPINIRVTGQVNFYWGRYVRPIIDWVEHWRGTLKSPVSDEVSFWVEDEAGARLIIGDETVIDGWSDKQARSGTLRLEEGQMYPMRLELLQVGQTPHMRLLWKLPGHDWVLVPGEALWHTSEDEQMARSEAGPVADERFDLTIGSGRLYDRPLDGMLDEMRVSDVVRYTEEFPIPGSLSRNYGPNPPKPTVPTGPPLLFTPDAPPLAFTPGAKPAPVQLGSRKHVFIDDVMIEARESVHLRSNPPKARQEDIQGVDMSTIPPSVYNYKGKEIRFITEGVRKGRGFEDPNPNVLPEERFKGTGYYHHHGIYLYVSPDGIHWRRNETIMYPFDPDGAAESFWDDQRGMYVAYIRNPGGLFWNPPFGRATVVGRTREIFKPWPFQPQPNPGFFARGWTIPSPTEELPVVFKPYNPDNPDPQGHVYRCRAIKYPWAPDTYVAFPWRLFSGFFDRRQGELVTNRDGDQHWKLPGLVDIPPDYRIERRQTELATSRNGDHWKFYGEPYYYPYGWEMEEGVEVIEAISHPEALVRRGDELWQYAWLITTSHGGGGKEFKGRSRVVRYVQRLDGFVSLDAVESPGWAMTRPFVFDGKRLELNVTARGQVCVGIRDEEDHAIPEFTVDDCDLIRADSVRQVVTWNGNPDVSKLAGKVVRLWFEMKDAKLYAFQFIEAQEF